MTGPVTTCRWHDVGSIDDVPVDRGVGVLVEGVQIAVFRLSALTADGAEEWYAVSHLDPATGVPVMARGLVGSAPPDDSDTGPNGAQEPIPTVAAPLHKQRYDLRTGRCLDDPALALATYRIVVADGRIHLEAG